MSSNLGYKGSSSAKYSSADNASSRPPLPRSVRDSYLSSSADYKESQYGSPRQFKASPRTQQNNPNHFSYNQHQLLPQQQHQQHYPEYEQEPNAHSRDQSWHDEDDPYYAQQQHYTDKSHGGHDDALEPESAQYSGAMHPPGVSERDVDDIFSFARHGRCEEVERLLTRGIPVDVKDPHGNTLLTIACQNGNKRVAKAVLRRGANINARNFKGNTPLHYCHHYGYGDSLGVYIISKGADVSAKNNIGLNTWEGI